MKYPDCDFPLRSVHEVSNSISDHLSKSKPFSLLRLGDGEGLLLSISNKSSESDFKYIAEHLGPESIGLADILRLKNRLKQAIKNADVIGVRDDVTGVTFDRNNFLLPEDKFLEIFRKQFKLRKVEKSIVKYRGARRIAFLHRYLSTLSIGDNCQFCSAWFHYDIHRSGDIFKLVGQQKKIGMISCRSTLPDSLSALLNIDVKFYEIPDMFRSIPKDRVPLNYIEQLEDVFDHQHVEFPGQLYLIGGGFYGKLYCELIKSQGGIALDLGSLFDAWVGVPSRKVVYKTMFDQLVSDSVVPPELLLKAENINPLR